jgi:hypothetical protein
MAICIYFPVEGMGADKYDEVIQRLEAAGQGAPAGRSFHVAFEMGDGLQVVDVWDSKEAFEAFGETLIPILTEFGINPGEPAIGPVHSMVFGAGA